MDPIVKAIYIALKSNNQWLFKRGSDQYECSVTYRVPVQHYEVQITIINGHLSGTMIQDMLSNNYYEQWI